MQNTAMRLHFRIYVPLRSHASTFLLLLVAVIFIPELYMHHLYLSIYWLCLSVPW